MKTEKQLQALLAKKYQLLLAYIHFGDQLRCLCRDGLYEHFKQHFKEEREQTYNLNKKLTAMGTAGQPTVPEVPTTDLQNTREILQILLLLETESVVLWSDLAKASVSDVALNGFAQNGAVECQAHVEDLKRYLRSEV